MCDVCSRIQADAPSPVTSPTGRAMQKAMLYTHVPYLAMESWMKAYPSLSDVPTGQIESAREHLLLATEEIKLVLENRPDRRRPA